MDREKKFLLILSIAMSISLALAIAAYAASPTVTTDKDTYYLTENITISVQADSSSLYRLAIMKHEDENITVGYGVMVEDTAEDTIIALLEIVDVKTGTIIDSYHQHNRLVMLIKTDSNGHFEVVVRTRDTAKAAGMYTVELLDCDTNTRYSLKSFIVESKNQTTTPTTTETTTTTTTTTTEITRTETATSPTETTETAFPLISPDELDSRVSLIMLIISILLLVIL